MSPIEFLRSTGKKFVSGPSKGTARPRRSEVTPFGWSGPRSPAASRNFLRWTAPIGFHWETPESESLRARSCFWIA
jgi:hypothetical protein